MRLAALAILAVGILPVAGRVQVQAPAAGGARRALLIGVSEFLAPEMKKHSLQGPANDVDLLRTVLQGPGFGLERDRVVTLAGLPSDPAARPTRANIEREFLRLRDQARAGDQIVVLLAGHGSQQPADPDPRDEEPDGLDEVFLPADVAGWDGVAGRVTNAIVDDEIARWLTEIRNKGAAVWLIVDSCHSGTMSRAMPEAPQRERRIPVDALVPSAAIEAARIRAGRARTTAQERTMLDLAEGAGALVAIYATDMMDVTPELAMPDKDGPVHGLFTYTIASLLAQRTEPLTYRELAQRTIDRYRAEGFAPTPAFEGGGLDREILGDRTTHDRPPFRIGARTATAGSWSLDAGSIHGLTKGSILEVFPPAEATDAGRSLGHMRIVSVAPTTALVAPVRIGDARAPAADRLVSGTRARIRYHEFGDLRLKVALEPPARQGPRRLEQALDALRTTSNGMAERANPKDAHWFVRTEGTRVILAPANAMQGVTSPPSSMGSDSRKPLDVGELTDASLDALLGDHLRRIARTANLSRMASYVDPEAKLQIRVIRSAVGALPARPLLAIGGDAGVNPGEYLEFEVKNTGMVPLDVTVLYLEAAYGIMPMFPGADTALDNRLDPGKSRLIGPISITGNPLGWESVVAIGVTSTLRHENFTSLAQESLVEVRTTDPPASALRKLLDHAMYGGRAETRSGEDDLGRFAISLASFRVELPRR